MLKELQDLINTVNQEALTFFSKNDLSRNIFLESWSHSRSSPLCYTKQLQGSSLAKSLTKAMTEIFQGEMWGKENL